MDNHLLYSASTTTAPTIRRKSTSFATATATTTTTVSSRKQIATSSTPPKASTTTTTTATVKMYKAKSPPSPKLSTTTTSPRPEPTIIKRRNSSFANTSSPWFRRNSFLSPTMIQDENFNVYESGNSFYSGVGSGGQYISNYSIISLRECQGFLFNQDLFATPYQQVRSQANAKRYRSSFSQRRRSGNGNGTGDRRCRDGDYERRHTSYHPQRPQFDNSMVSDNAVVDDDDDDDDDDDGEDEEMHDADEEFPTNESKGERRRLDEDGEDEDGEDEDEDGEDGEDDEDEEDEDDYREMHEYGGDFNNRRYRVRVTEIVVDEKEDNDIFPTSEI
ncbi:hypothetical protein KGF57_003128 [Candida theae]|uniref:Uncharacterized protein n=1 Tax=Candida theae TaxID=1198502 RepID=A0AAD5FY89_9ASCO|nr:uncharacterized protein KGF57_003128 [Candida theae]KAI5957861.1 hypothetical protein KGF57_003128 [Candida theae]